MSIQAGWNRVIGSMAVLGGLKKFSQGQSDTARALEKANQQQLEIEQINQRRLDAHDPNFTGPLPPQEEAERNADFSGQADRESAENEEIYRQQAFDENFTPSLTPEQIAAYRAQQAAQAANSAPQRTLEEIVASIANYSEMPGQATAARIASMTPPVPRRLPGGDR